MKNKTITLLLFLFSTNVYPWCSDLNIIDNPGTVNLNNDLSPRTSLRLDRGDTYSSCDIKIGVTKGSSSNYNRKLFSIFSDINFNIAKSNSMSPILKDYYDSSGNTNIIFKRFRSNSRNPYKRFNLYCELTLNGNESPGTYTDTFYIKLYQRFLIFFYEYRSIPITYTYTVPNNINLSIVDSNQPFDLYDTSQDLNFGTISNGDQKSFDIVVQSNTGYQLQVSSHNNGKIKHTSTSSKINYTFKANGSAINLQNSNANPVTIGTGIGPHPSDGFRIPIQVEMGDPASKLAGTYEDHLVITVTTNL